MYQIINPPNHLKEIVRHYWLLDLSDSSIRKNELMFAYPYVNLVFTFGSAYSVKPKNSDLIKVEETRVLGSRTVFAEYNHPVGNLAFGVTFQFGYANQFFKENPENLLNQIIPLSSILPQQNWLSDAFSELTLSQFITLLNVNIEKHADASISANHNIWNSFLFAIINEGKFNISIENISRQLRISQRHLQRICLQFSGLTPKSIQSLLRCRLAIRQILKSKKNIDLFAFGYFDQSHFIRDVQRWTGESPNKLFHQLITRQ